MSAAWPSGALLLISLGIWEKWVPASTKAEERNGGCSKPPKVDRKPSSLWFDGFFAFID
jgi:hypothetical protein